MKGIRNASISISIIYLSSNIYAQETGVDARGIEGRRMRFESLSNLRVSLASPVFMIELSNFSLGACLRALLELMLVYRHRSHLDHLILFL